MNQESIYPRGIQTFSKIIKGNYLYVDKTALIYELVSNNNYVFLSRPRRFGKSLLISTIEAYFRGERELFKGLAIDELEKDWKSYPVFHFDLTGGNYEDPDEVVSIIDEYLSEWEEEYGLESSGKISIRFSKLLAHVYKTTGKQAVILIDEYDKPLLDTLDKTEVHERHKKDLSAFYGVMKKRDACIKFGMITGITKFGKLNIFSGLNNLRDISLLPKFNAICGITETEFRQYFSGSIIEFAKAYGWSEDETWEKFKKQYDGYLFAKEGENIYNPYSVLNAFADNELKNYWFSTGSSTYLLNVVKQSRMPVDDLDGALRNEDELSDIIDLTSDMASSLFQSGYLTIKGYNWSTQFYTLGYPNEEVKMAFWNSLAREFFKLSVNDFGFKISEFVKDVEEGRPEDFLVRLKALIADVTPGIERNKEVHFQNVMAIIFKMMGYSARTEVSSSAGRCDLQIETSSYVYIFEFKLNGSAEEALNQIIEKGYYRPFLADRRTVFLIGAEFSTKDNTLSDWKITNAISLKH